MDHFFGEVQFYGKLVAFYLSFRVSVDGHSVCYYYLGAYLENFSHFEPKTTTALAV